MPCSMPVTMARPGTISAFMVLLRPAQSLCSPKRQRRPGTKSSRVSFSFAECVAIDIIVFLPDILVIELYIYLSDDII